MAYLTYRLSVVSIIGDMFGGSIVGDGILIPGESYTYRFDDGIDEDIISRMVALWRQMWCRLPNEVKVSCTEYVRAREGYRSCPFMEFLARGNRDLRDFAWSLRRGRLFEFKPDTLGLFSDDGILAIYGHELAHLYLTSIGDPYHGALPFSREDKIEREHRADTCARSWGFDIDQCRKEGSQLKAEHPEAFV